jgi:hypothetical protein
MPIGGFGVRRRRSVSQPNTSTIDAKADHDAELDALVGPLGAAGLIESYTTSEGEPWMRLTRAGERVAHQLPLMPVRPGAR